MRTCARPSRWRPAARTLIPGVLILVVGGCSLGFGPTPDVFGPAQRPTGVAATLRLPADMVEGELLEVRDSTLLLLTPSPARLALVRLSAIQAGQFAQVRERIVRGAFRSDEDRRVIRRLSRFPAGIPASALAALLEAHGQSAPDSLP